MFPCHHTVNDIPYADLKRSREVGDLKSLERVSILRIEFNNRTVVKRRHEIIDYFRVNGCHCKDHLNVQCRVKLDQLLPLFSHLRHLERENYRHCVFEGEQTVLPLCRFLLSQPFLRWPVNSHLSNSFTSRTRSLIVAHSSLIPATAAELELSNSLEELDAANRAIHIDNLAALSRAPNNEPGNQTNGDPFVMMMPDLVVMQNQLNDLIDNSTDSAECPLAMVECLLEEQNDGEASRATVSDRRVSIFEEWKTATADRQPAESFGESAVNGDASTSVPSNLPAQSLSSMLIDSIASSSSSDVNETRPRMISRFYNVKTVDSKRQDDGLSRTPSNFSNDDEPSSDGEENTTREQGGLSATNFSAVNLSLTNSCNGIQKKEPVVRHAAIRPLKGDDLSSIETAFDCSVPDNVSSTIETAFDRSHPDNASHTTAIDRSDASFRSDDLDDLDDLEVIYRNRPIKREILDDEPGLIDCTSEEREDLSKRFKIDSEGCIVIE